MPYSYRLTIAYHGRNFGGWQRQTNTRTVQGTIEDTLHQIIPKQQITLTGAARTDSGVHALAQVALLCVDKKIDPDKIRRSLNKLLFPEIVVDELVTVADSFHPIRDARSKIYRYWLSSQVSPFLYPYVWYLSTSLDIEAMRRAAQVLQGRHDFSAFCATDCSAQGRVRELRKIIITTNHPPLTELWFYGTGFLKQMVRIMCGTLVEIARGQQHDIKTILASTDRRRAGMTAPAKGLALVKIVY